MTDFLIYIIAIIGLICKISCFVMLVTYTRKTSLIDANLIYAEDDEDSEDEEDSEDTREQDSQTNIYDFKNAAGKYFKFGLLVDIILWFIGSNLSVSIAPKLCLLSLMLSILCCIHAFIYMTPFIKFIDKKAIKNDVGKLSSVTTQSIVYIFVMGFMWWFIS